MGTPADFLRNAHECIELARHTANTAHQKLLVDLAVKWLQLAEVTRREIGLITNIDKQSAA
jgi:hypothetical protein